jgi:hypothetical protein
MAKKTKDPSFIYCFKENVKNSLNHDRCSIVFYISRGKNIPFLLLFLEAIFLVSTCCMYSNQCVLRIDLGYN